MTTAKSVDKYGDGISGALRNGTIARGILSGLQLLPPQPSNHSESRSRGGRGTLVFLCRVGIANCGIPGRATGGCVNHTKLSKQALATIRRMRKKSHRVSEIAAEIGVSTTTLYRWVHQHDLWQMRSCGRKAA